MTAVVALVGPTGVGKTERSLALAEALGGEIVNCDSRQIYRGMDVGTAKPSAAERARVPHHLFDIVEPDESFDCARYHSLARAALAEIQARGRSVVLVGGTGLYLKALRFGLFPGPGRDDAVRARLLERERTAPGCLHRELSSVDAEAARRIHPNDRVRVVRALEVYQLTGTRISEWQAQHRFAGDRLEMSVLGLRVERSALYRRIDERCVRMLDAGLIDEVRGLLAAGCSPASAAMTSIGYREAVAHLRGEISLEQAVQAMQRSTRRFAKRQMTWFRPDPTIRWLDGEHAELDDLLAAAAH